MRIIGEIDNKIHNIMEIDDLDKLIVLLETALPVLWSKLVKEGVITAERLVELLVTNPRRRFGITSDAGLTVWSIEKQYEIDPDRFASMGRATPFAGKTVQGENLLTVYQNKIVYQNIAEN